MLELLQEVLWYIEEQNDFLKLNKFKSYGGDHMFKSLQNKICKQIVKLLNDGIDEKTEFNEPVNKWAAAVQIVSNDHNQHFKATNKCVCKAQDVNGHDVVNSSHTNGESNEEMRQYRCSICKERFTSKHLLKSHVMGHKRYDCNTCERFFFKVKHLKKHILSKHTDTNGDKDNNNFKANVTPEARKNSHTLPNKCSTEHENKATEGIDNTTPNENTSKHKELSSENNDSTETLAGIVFPNDLSKSVMELSQNNNIKIETTADLEAKASEHERKSSQKELFNELTKDNTNSRIDRITPFQCSKCNHKLTSQKNLEIHMRRHDGEITCNICQRIFSLKFEYDLHMMDHKGKQPECKCKVCGYQHLNEQDLKKHMENHMPSHSYYVCKQCNAAFTSKKLILIHEEQMHIKTYECKECSEKFCWKGDLMWHKRVHFPDRPFKCPLCPITFNRKHDLEKRHILTHERNGTLQCTTCNRPFNLALQLKLHYKDEHGKDWPFEY